MFRKMFLSFATILQLFFIAANLFLGKMRARCAKFKVDGLSYFCTGARQVFATTETNLSLLKFF